MTLIKHFRYLDLVLCGQGYFVAFLIEMSFLSIKKSYIASHYPWTADFLYDIKILQLCICYGDLEINCSLVCILSSKHFSLADMDGFSIQSFLPFIKLEISTIEGESN